MRLERIPSASIVLITDDFINFYEKDSKIFRFAYFDPSDKELKETLERSIRKDKPIDLLIERKLKGKEYDYVIEALIYSTEI